ncbi:EAL domain-containing protein [Sphingomonas sp. DG1-23]|uniref:EAL domain-containing protein n=1 Tax=Sphingomonas sp. DG1-23 TaxID=3068316 RepID=UPI00273DB8E8|nr:EAL domain-containing protein [Sphingomonas sp. DG1-23]MDP5277861.1 EAL domain-containing protein [Sphingomonas sp. DG1-23]
MESQAVTSEVESGQRSESGLTIAFQPIADISGNRVYAYEAIIRGPNGETAAQIFDSLSPEAKATFDQRCAAGAIRWAMSAGLGTSGARLLIPVQAESIGSPAEHLEPILRVSRQSGLIPERLIFGLDGYRQLPGRELAEIIDVHRKAGPLTAFVGLGPGHAGLALCGRYLPDLVILESELVSAIASSWSRRLVLEDLTPRIRSLGLKVIATGVDSEPVLQRLRGFGIMLVQGEEIASPAVRSLPIPTLRHAA